MRYWAISPSAHVVDERRVRAMRFDERSMLPVSAACVIASGIRETLGQVLGQPVDVRLFEPSLPPAAAWPAILRDAKVYLVRGCAGEAAIVVRAADAGALAAAAFGESERGASSLSPLESTALERTIAALASAFAPLCGDAPHARACADPGALATYFEVQIERPIRARVGVGLRRDPDPPCVAGAVPELHDVPLVLHVRLDAGECAAGCLAALEPGSLVNLSHGRLQGSLVVAGSVLAGGEVGVSGGRYALLLDRAPSHQGSTTAA